MSRYYRVAYRLGITPWEQVAPRQAEQIAALLDQEENGHQPPFGPALDLGCGSGVWSVALARRGWRVTGVDNVPKALRRARTRARDAGVDARFVSGDVTALRPADVGSGYRFLLDFECFNHLDDAERRAMGRALGALTAPDATMVLLVWAPGRRGPLPRGASRDDIETAFPEWAIVDEEAFDESVLPAPLKSTRPRYYRLRRD
jgi:SAM-dependent methyltransferase